MAMMIITYRVMPEDSEIEYSKLEEITKEKITQYHESVKINNVEEHDVGFGLKAVKVNFSIDESQGSEDLENELIKTEEIGDVVVESMSRAMG